MGRSSGECRSKRRWRDASQAHFLEIKEMRHGRTRSWSTMFSTSPVSILEPPRRSSLPSTFQQLRVHTGWRMTWTHIVGGKFSSSHDDAVLFYEGGYGVRGDLRHRRPRQHLAVAPAPGPRAA